MSCYCVCINAKLVFKVFISNRLVPGLLNRKALQLQMWCFYPSNQRQCVQGFAVDQMHLCCFFAGSLIIEFKAYLQKDVLVYFVCFCFPSDYLSSTFTFQKSKYPWFGFNYKFHFGLQGSIWLRLENICTMCVRRRIHERD